MSWFEDLTPYTYGHAESTSAPTLNVGWLERARDVPIGDVPAAFVTRLAELVGHAPTRATPGMHYCDLCPPSEDDEHPWGNAEVRAVGADGTRFAAPSLIHHYVAVHRYQPPVLFIAAVMRTIHLGWDDALESGLCIGCGLALERLDVEAVRNGTLERAVVVRMRCDRCATDYERVLDRRQELLAVGNGEPPLSLTEPRGIGDDLRQGTRRTGQGRPRESPALVGKSGGWHKSDARIRANS